MIELLRIEGLAVVESAELELAPGLNVLTGETGAGKSLVLGALALLAGARGSAEVVRSGAREARVEAVLETARAPALAERAGAAGIALEDGTLVVARHVSASGRSRARIGGALVPVGSLAELLAEHVEIASQHESQALLRPETQLRLLDAYAGLGPKRASVEAGVRGLRELDAEIATLRAEAEERARREDFLAFQVREIDELALEPGELERLRAERGRLAHAERLGEDAALAVRALAGDADAFEAPGAADRLAEAARRAEALAEVDGALAPLAARLRDAQAEASEAANELERWGAGLEPDPARLATAEERLARIEKLQRKYGEDEARILAFREQAAAELAAIGGADARLAKLAEERAGRVATLTREAEQLSRGRRRAAKRLAAEVGDALAGLALAGARFEVALPEASAGEGLPCASSGAETVRFELAANPGEPARPLRRVASGGELSRVFLAVKNTLRRSDAGGVLVFDEIDAGVGGQVADRVGAVLAELASAHQVLCITHLPQIAARADRHFRVRKATRGGRSQARVEPLEREARIEELARMAGGARVSEATRRHARALLDAAGR